MSRRIWKYGAVALCTTSMVIEIIPLGRLIPGAVHPKIAHAADLPNSVNSRTSSKDDPAVVAILITALNDPDKTVRLSAASALGSRGKNAKQAVPTLIRLLKDPDKDVRSNAAYALGSMNSPSPVSSGTTAPPIAATRRLFRGQ